MAFEGGYFSTCVNWTFLGIGRFAPEISYIQVRPNPWNTAIQSVLTHNQEMGIQF